MAATAAAMLSACGASIQAVYEGDVRFEHCMALDARPDVKPTLRRACWKEWVEFYTFGQTRDRVDYALLREQQLASASDFDEAPAVASARAAPDPMSAIAPPPMLMAAAASDAGAPDAAPAEEGDARTRCASDCQHRVDVCRQACRSAACERACSLRRARCAARCEKLSLEPRE